MCSQFDYLHDDLPIGLGSREPKEQHHAKRREIRSPKSSVAVAMFATAHVLSSTDELTLRMIFGDH